MSDEENPLLKVLKEKGNMDSFYGEVKMKGSINPDTNWVPIESGQMPDDNGIYQVTRYTNRNWTDVEVGSARFYKSVNRFRKYYFDMEIIAWRNLPEPYRPKSRQLTQKEFVETIALATDKLKAKEAVFAPNTFLEKIKK